MVSTDGDKRNHTKASVAQRLGRSIMFLGFMTRIAQSLVYWMLVASEVTSTLLCYHNSVGDEDVPSKTPRNEFDASSKQKSQRDTRCDIGNSLICQITLMLAGRKLEDYKRHYIETLKMTRVALGYLNIAKAHMARLAKKSVDRQTVRTQHDEEPDDDRPTYNMLDPQVRSILVRVLSFLTMCIVYIGVWIGDRLPTSFIMVIQGPTGTTQHVAGLDSGSAENLISRRTALALGLSIGPYEGSSEWPVLDGVGISICPVGWVTVRWCVSNFDTAWYTTTFAVLEDGHCKGFNILLSREEIDKRRFYIRNRGVFFVQRGSNSL
ncbi:MAG: hypothetical protein Q9184_001168 [Pyrenodesmia sp. 2 TL-2023]